MRLGPNLPAQLTHKIGPTGDRSSNNRVAPTTLAHYLPVNSSSCRLLFLTLPTPPTVAERVSLRRADSSSLDHDWRSSRCHDQKTR